MKRFLLIIGVVAATGTGTLSAQSAVRADGASRTARTQDIVQTATETTTSENDVDLGEQQPLSAAKGGLGAYLIGDAGVYFTSNPLLSNDGSAADLYFAERTGAGIHPNLTSSLYLDTHVSFEAFQYMRNSSLNFNRFNAGGGFDYVFEDLGQLMGSIRYEYERYLNGKNLQEFYVNNALNVMLTKQFLLTDTQSIQTGVQGSFSLTAQPSIARRDSYDFWIGHRWRIIEPLELQTYYVISLFYYPSGDRVDVTQNVGGSLNYYFTKWAKVSASAGFGANNSTDSYFNYTVVNVGLTLGLDIRF